MLFDEAASSDVTWAWASVAASVDASVDASGSGRAPRWGCRLAPESAAASGEARDETSAAESVESSAEAWGAHSAESTAGAWGAKLAEALGGGSAEVLVPLTVQRLDAAWAVASVLKSDDARGVALDAVQAEL